MMPGETHPAAPGPADLARCQGCASLQQNLNEYVEALIALKQKIINTDNLLTEYQKKCDDILSLLVPVDGGPDLCVITQR
uniref:Interactor of little elongation complex ELL subunit 1 n=1 Tax=Mus musculus TaxID=10090 RepID=A0A1Y7VML5_MOUSE